VGYGELTENQDTISHTYTEIFEELCPYYISIGMSYDEYWYGEAKRVKSYRESEVLRRKSQNYNDWLIGLYVYSAVGKLSPLFNNFKPQPPDDYPDKPYPVTNQDIKERHAEEMKKKAEGFKAFVELKNAENKRKREEVTDDAG
jgi:hypothetical protein